ncbi:TraR/DksA C4-type zinc finger protein [Paenibacillus sp. alder61]|uniref:TraR/DksA C4-type zinc finger protein n=1 Tax=Paenibacillus sp. alder61 TaxID=2862948 RepID=UPI001CD74F8A|nr:TraR/DksA C4-type zinc finger protein [Paenibacillus sp. alder61]MCA1292088.1 TraR/DksA C4-type zinc finger protein [Paenibacillus sp. alder61]
MNHLTKEQLQTLRDMLVREKRDLEHHFDKGNEESVSDESLRVSTGELSSYDNHPADVGTETFERSRDLAVDENLRTRLDEIDRALDKIEDLTYGSCEVCHREIPYERLEILPYTSFCVEHTPERTISNDRPVEEDVMTTPPKGAGEHRQRDAGAFDDAGAWRSLEEYGNSDSPAMAAKRNAPDYNSLSMDED